MPPPVPTCLGEREVGPGEHLSEGLPRGVCPEEFSPVFIQGFTCKFAWREGAQTGGV